MAGFDYRAARLWLEEIVGEEEVRLLDDAAVRAKAEESGEGERFALKDRTSPTPDDRVWTLEGRLQSQGGDYVYGCQLRPGERERVVPERVAEQLRAEVDDLRIARDAAVAASEAHRTQRDQARDRVRELEEARAPLDAFEQAIWAEYCTEHPDAPLEPDHWPQWLIGAALKAHDLASAVRVNETKGNDDDAA